MPDLLSGQSGWDIQVRIWGYVTLGDLTDLTAMVAEGSPVPIWDRTAADLASQWVSRDNAPYRRVKEHAALPWLTEHALRGHIPWSPL